EWRGSTMGSSSVSVSLTPRDGETTLQTYVNRTEPLLGTFAGFGLPVAGVIGVLMGKLVFGESDAGIVAAFFSGMVPAMLFARGLWKRSTKKWKERLFGLMDAMAKEAEDAARRKEEDEEGPAEDV
ncbi:hypothetical protein ACGF5M_03610, partial [Gemmatimonadota bacterium]